ncbi:MAG: hypothetical protein K5839_04120 [Treponemataceae bacterium]|nr:hypothetical protein [Treponemataceae bacterium]
MSVFILDLICILVLSIVYTDGRKKVYDLSQKIFNKLIVAIQIFLFLDGLSWICQDYMNPATVIIEKVIMTLIFAFQGSMGFLHILYTESFLRGKKQFHKLYWITMFIQIGISSVLMVINIFTDIIFSITVEGNYQRGPLYLCNYVLYSAYFITAIVITFLAYYKSVSKLQKKRCLIYLAGLGFVTAGFIIQSISSVTNYTAPAHTLFILFIYLILQNSKMEEIKNSSQKKLEAKTFGSFDIFYKGQSIKFKRSKSKELLAVLIDKNGSSVSMGTLSYLLWENRSEDESTKSLLRTLISDIRNTFNELGIDNFFIKEYNSVRINSELISCDYYDLLRGNPDAKKLFAGEYMNQYSWAEERIGYLERLKNEK